MEFDGVCIQAIHSFIYVGEGHFYSIHLQWVNSKGFGKSKGGARAREKEAGVALSALVSSE